MGILDNRRPACSSGTLKMRDGHQMGQGGFALIFTVSRLSLVRSLGCMESFILQALESLSM